MCLTPAMGVCGNWCVSSLYVDIANAADIDEENVQTSQNTAAMNKLDSRIRILKTDADDELIPLRLLDTKT